MSDNGFILLHRRILSNEVLDTPVSKFHFLQMCMEASYCDGKKVFIRGNYVTVNRGQFAITTQSLTNKFNSSDSTKKHHLTTNQVRKFLEKLVKAEMISVKSNGSFSVITIIKYNTYNDYGVPKTASHKVGEEPTRNRREVDEELKSVNGSMKSTYGNPVHKKDEELARNGRGMGEEPTRNCLPSIEDIKNKRNSSCPDGQNSISPSTEKETSQVLFSDPPTVAAMAKTKSPPQSRKRTDQDDYMDAIAKVCGMNLSNKEYAARIGKAVKHFKAEEIDHRSILRFPEVWEKWGYDGLPMPETLVKHSPNIKQLKPKISFQEAQHQAYVRMKQAQANNSSAIYGD